MKKSKKQRNAEKKAVQNRKNIHGNVLILKGGYVPSVLDQSEYYDNLQKTRIGTGKHKDKRNNLREKAQRRDDLSCAFLFCRFKGIYSLTTTCEVCRVEIFNNNKKDSLWS